MTLQFDPHFVRDQFSLYNFDARLKNMCNAAVPDIPLHWYKLKWPITFDLPESWTVLSGAFHLLLGIFGDLSIWNIMQGNANFDFKINANKQTNKQTKNKHFVCFFSSPEPLTHCELLLPLVVRRVSSTIASTDTSS